MEGKGLKKSEAPKGQAFSQQDRSIFRHKTFTTKPKLRRVVLHRQQTVRNRVYALQESFYPTKDVPYNAVRHRMATLLGIVDRMSVLAYLGRPESEQKSVMEQTVRYLKSGATVPKRHYFKRKLPAKKGYIEIFGLGYVYIREGEWWVHWNHTTQLTLPESEGLEHEKVSKDDFSLSYNSSKGNKENSTPNNQSELYSDSEREERECYKRERNLAFCVKSVKNEPSFRDFLGRWRSAKGQTKLNELEKAILRIDSGCTPPCEGHSKKGEGSQ